MINQDVFIGEDEKWKWAAVDKSGVVALYTHKPSAAANAWAYISGKGKDWKWAELSVGIPPEGLSDEAWKGSLIERQVVCDGASVTAECARQTEEMHMLDSVAFAGEFPPKAIEEALRLPVPERPDPQIGELLYEAERAKLKLQKARKRAAQAVAEGAMAIEVFAAVFE